MAASTFEGSRNSSLPADSPVRIALYSHDAMGLGHMRRNMLIAERLAETLRVGHARTHVLLFAGTHLLNQFPVSAGVDAITLPAFRKTPSGTYESGALGVTSEHLRALRASTLEAALQAFRPHLFLVDKRPLGVLGELEPALEAIRRHGHTRVVLGLRDILDGPRAVREEWERAGNETAIADYYDQIWIYGDREVFDAPTEYDFSSATRSKVRFTGYLDAGCRVKREAARTSSNDDRRTILCQVGGGQDGEALATAFSEAKLPRGIEGIILTGPFMPEAARNRLQARVESRDNLSVLPFSTAPGELLDRAERVVSMGGYNTLSEVLSTGKPALVVPRTTPRSEQLMRARCFAELGLVDMLHPDDASPAAISAWCQQDAPRREDIRRTIDFGGLDRLPGLVDGLVAAPDPQPFLQVDRRRSRGGVHTHRRVRTRAGVMGS